MLYGCASAPPSPAPTLIVNACATPTPCQLPASSPRTNGDLNLLIEEVESAWALCAAKVDAVIACHQQIHQEPPPWKN
ncbi:Rz1-like lysis system protein LysC [Alkalilimnicola ehrlichii]|uniref:Rz1-like lysis system protein LysC n=1 Tax=Alkalilimnicola ehrlichii TaxID=351052 RepID=UPI00384F5860